MNNKVEVELKKQEPKKFGFEDKSPFDKYESNGRKDNKKEIHYVTEDTPVFECIFC